MNTQSSNIRMHLPPDLRMQIVKNFSHRAVGRDYRIDRLIWEGGCMKKEAFWSLLTHKDAGRSMSHLLDLANTQTLKGCLRQAVKHHKIKVINVLWEYVCLSPKEEEDILASILKKATDIESLQIILSAIKTSSYTALGYAAGKAPNIKKRISLQTVLQELADNGAVFSTAPISLVDHIIKENDAESFDIISPTLNGQRFKTKPSIYMRSDAINEMLMMKILRSDIEFMIKDYVIVRELIPKYHKHAKEMYDIIARRGHPQVLFKSLINQGKIDRGKDLLNHLPDITWDHVDLQFKSDWPDEALDMYLSRVQNKRIKLDQIYEPKYRRDYFYTNEAALEKPNKTTHKFIMACIRNHVVIDALPDRALAWACQSGDLDQAKVLIKEVEMSKDPDKNVFVILAMSWKRNDVVDFLLKYIGAEDLSVYT